MSLPPPQRATNFQDILKSSSVPSGSDFSVLGMATAKETVPNMKNGFKCLACKEVFTSIYNLTLHHKSWKNQSCVTHSKPTNQPKYVCKPCDYVFDKLQNYRRHLTTAKHNKRHLQGKFDPTSSPSCETPACNVCHLKFRNLTQLESHCTTTQHKLRVFALDKNSPSVTPPFRCEFCKVCYYNQANLIRHNQSKKHLTATGKIQLSLLEQHVNQHNLRCLDCDQVFVTKAGHRRHLHSYQHRSKSETYGVGTWECKTCEQFFTVKDSLTKHYKSKKHAKRLSMILPS